LHYPLLRCAHMTLPCIILPLHSSHKFGGSSHSQAVSQLMLSYVTEPTPPQFCCRIICILCSCTLFMVLKWVWSLLLG
jgi:hypothetical protein